jgi:hypothetical protein
MTISNKARQANYTLAFDRIMAIVGDGSFSLLIDPRRIDFKDVIPTTWEDLEREGLLVKDAGGIGFQHYRLTSEGWIAGLERLGKLRETVFRQDLQKLLAALKSWVEDRLPHSVLPDQIAARAGLSLDFIGNVIQTKLLEREFPNDLVDVLWRGWNRAVTIPGGFGRKK